MESMEIFEKNIKESSFESIRRSIGCVTALIAFQNKFIWLRLSGFEGLRVSFGFCVQRTVNALWCHNKVEEESVANGVHQNQPGNGSAWSLHYQEQS